MQQPQPQTPRKQLFSTSMKPPFGGGGVDYCRFSAADTHSRELNQELEEAVVVKTPPVSHYFFWVSFTQCLYFPQLAWLRDYCILWRTAFCFLQWIIIVFIRAIWWLIGVTWFCLASKLELEFNIYLMRGVKLLGLNALLWVMTWLLSLVWLHKDDQCCLSVLIGSF